MPDISESIAASDTTFAELNVLVAFSATENLHDTALTLHLSVPTVHRLLHSLQQRLPTAIIDRKGKGLALTRSGWTLVSEATKILRARNEAIDMMFNAADSEKPPLRIGYSFSMGLLYIPAILKLYMEGRDSERVTMTQDSSTSLVPRLLSGQLDVIISSSAPSAIGIIVRPLFEDGIVMAIPDGYISSGIDDPSHLDSYQSAQFISMEHGSNSNALLIRSCAQAGFSPHITLTVKTLFNVVIAVAAGLGISVLPRRMSDFHIPGIQYLPVEEHVPTTRTICLSYPSDSAKQERIQRFERMAKLCAARL